MAMKFSEMTYTRPDLEKIKAEMTRLTDAFRAADCFETADALFIEKDRLYRHVDTAATLASIRHSVNTEDPFYDGEEKFWNNAMPQLQEYMQRFSLALLESPFRPALEEKYGSVIFLNAELEQRAFSPALIPLMQEENELTQEYEKLLAGAQIPFRGGVYTLSQLSPFKTDADDAVRLAAWQAEGAWFKENAARLDEIYDRLVHLRDRMGKQLGYPDFTELGYLRMARNCYTKQDVERFRAEVVNTLVPLAAELKKKQSERIGVPYPLSFADNALLFRSGNPKPQGDEDAILRQALRFYTALSPETKTFFETMLSGELLDVRSTKGKASGGYCTSIFDYEVPFIFANFNGTSADVETVTHEAGHAFAGWLNRRRVPCETVWPSLEACEVHSMSMEFFSWPWAEGFYGADTPKFYASHLAGAITFIPYGTMVDHFQHIVYENPSLTPAGRHAEWKRLLGIYMPWLRLDGEIPFYADGEGWQRQHHIYSSPFYYIDYCLAQTVALEFWAKILADVKEAWRCYMAYTSLGGSRVFTELLETAGLKSPFDPACLQEVGAAAAAWLGANDPAALR